MPSLYPGDWTVSVGKRIKHLGNGHFSRSVTAINQLLHSVANLLSLAFVTKILKLTKLL